MEHSVDQIAVKAWHKIVKDYTIQIDDNEAIAIIKAAIEEDRAERPRVIVDPTQTRAAEASEPDMLEWAWSIIANVGGGDWEKESKEWKNAAIRWRDEYFGSMKQVSKSSIEQPNVHEPPAQASEEPYIKAPIKEFMEEQWAAQASEEIICPTCKQDMNEPPRQSKYGDCPQCGQGLPSSAAQASEEIPSAKIAPTPPLVTELPSKQRCETAPPLPKI